jgi:acyl dehydratase
MESDMTIFETPEELLDFVGQEVGVSDWLEITQERVDTFADATDDHQWIHVDPVKAAGGPYGGTIAHGYLTLALLAPLMRGTYEVKNRKLAVNYGLNKVRFPAPVPVGSRVRARNVLEAAERTGDMVQIVWSVTVEIEGAAKPACVAESVVRIYV